MDCNKLSKRSPNNDNSVTVASSDYKKLPLFSTDPVIDYQYKVLNQQKYSDIMQLEANENIVRYMNPDVVYQHSMNNKVADFQDYLALMTTAPSSNEVPKQINPKPQFYQNQFNNYNAMNEWNSTYPTDNFMSRQHSYPHDGASPLSPEAQEQLEKQQKKNFENHSQLIKNLEFYKSNREGQTKEEFKSIISNDFKEFKNHIKKCQKKQLKPYDYDE